MAGVWKDDCANAELLLVMDERDRHWWVVNGFKEDARCRLSLEAAQWFRIWVDKSAEGNVRYGTEGKIS